MGVFCIAFTLLTIGNLMGAFGYAHRGPIFKWFRWIGGQIYVKWGKGN